MLSDRPYMRDRYAADRTSVLGWLISAIVAGFGDLHHADLAAIGAALLFGKFERL